MTYTKLLEVEAVIGHLAAEGHPERLFVVPSQVLQERVFRPPLTSMRKVVYFPYERTRTYKPLIDYRQYENAWHLLPPKDSPAP